MDTYGNFLVGIVFDGLWHLTSALVVRAPFAHGHILEPAQLELTAVFGNWKAHKTSVDFGLTLDYVGKAKKVLCGKHEGRLEELLPLLVNWQFCRKDLVQR